MKRDNVDYTNAFVLTSSGSFVTIAVREETQGTVNYTAFNIECIDGKLMLKKSVEAFFVAKIIDGLAYIDESSITGLDNVSSTFKYRTLYRRLDAIERIEKNIVLSRQLKAYRYELEN